MYRLREALAILILSLSPALVLAQAPEPLGDAFPVDEEAPSLRWLTAASMGDDGSFVLTWIDWNLADPSQTAVMGRLFDRDGNALGPSRRLDGNAGRVFSGSSAAVAKLADGGFVAVWRSVTSDRLDEGIFARRFGSDGEPLGDETRVSRSKDPTSTEKVYIHGYLPGVAAISDGGFVVVWDEMIVEPGRWMSLSVIGRRYSGDAGWHPEFQVDEDPRREPFIAANMRPAVARRGSGFVVAWVRGARGAENALYARLFDGAGVPVASQQTVAEPVSDYLGELAVPVLPSVASGADVTIVAWNDGASRHVRAQRLDEKGAPLGDPIDVGPNLQSYPASVAMSANGDWVVSWSDLLDLDPIDEWHVSARHFAADGTASSIFYPSLPPGTPGSGLISVAMSDDGRILLGWTAGTAPDYGLRARLYQVQEAENPSSLIP